MILVSLFSEDNVLSDEIKICYISEYQSNENRAFRFFFFWGGGGGGGVGDTRYNIQSTCLIITPYCLNITPYINLHSFYALAL